MNVINCSTALVALAGVVALTGCGGGGGVVSVAPELEKVPIGTKGFPQAATKVGVETAAKSDPKFGSVYQASQDTPTTVTWVNQNISVTAGALSLSEPADVEDLGDPENPVPIDPLSVHASGSGKQYDLLRKNGNVLSGAVVRISYDSTDYVAAGYWLHSPDISAADPVVQVGAFVDGPEFDGGAITSTSSSATYSGDFGGIYAQGSDFAVGATGAVSLTADFSGATVRGEITDLETSISTGLGEGVKLVLKETAIVKSNGQITAADVKVQIGDDEQPSSTGKWGGRFSNQNNPDGDPRLVAGTAGAQWGSASVVGAFVAEKPPAPSGG